MKEGLTAVIPKDKKKLKQEIEALEYLLQQECDEKSKEIYQQTLRQYKTALKKRQKICQPVTK